ncbi:MAG: Rne/Rng family ribonuclease [Acidiphilium sp.]
MPRMMLIDASHAEETRVAVLDGNRLDDFDIETDDKKQIKGNIYLAKVVRVEPSLQAAFVEYGGNRHGFLAFAEIHPDYYQIPIADRQRLIELEAEEARRREAAEEAAELAAEARARAGLAPETPAADDQPASEPASEFEQNAAPTAQALETGLVAERFQAEPDAALPDHHGLTDTEIEFDPAAIERELMAPRSIDPADAEQPDIDGSSAGELGVPEMTTSGTSEGGFDDSEAQPTPEQVGGENDAAEEARERRRTRIMRQYKIQEVIHRRQILLIQVIKEERGSKGAALTTYISLAGRFSVLMPNSPNGGGVSRKITAHSDRKRLKEVMAELEIPDGMGMIVRTAGANRPKPEIKRDCEYLLRLWDDIRERTMSSVAPSLIYEEASLIKRTIRDVYTREVDTVYVEGAEGFRAARNFMAMLMPSHVRKVQQWTEKQPLFARHQVEQMIEQVFQPTVQLRSGGYLVINQTEALVAIDVNSGRATRERNIEDTALRTNMEAAEEVARQLRLRDLAGLIVVDFIDMEVRKHNAMVERKLKDALKGDRARIQVGSISHFGLLEMSRQRLRPSLAETMLIPCPHCDGAGHVRSAASLALAVLRALEDEGAKHAANRQAAEFAVHLAADVALYIVNHKRAELAAIETRFGMIVRFVADAATPTQFRVEKLRVLAAPTRSAADQPLAMGGEIAAVEEAGFGAADTAELDAPGEAMGSDAARDARAEASAEASAEATEEEKRSRRRRRRRRGRRGEGSEAGDASDAGEGSDGADDASMATERDADDTAPSQNEPAADDRFTPALTPIELPAVDVPREPRRRRPPRRRGGAARGEGSEDAASAPVSGSVSEPVREPVAPPMPREEPIYLDIADIFEAAERKEAERAAAARAEAAARQARPAPRDEVMHETQVAATPPEPVPAPAPIIEPTPEPVTEPSNGEPPTAPAVQPIVIGAAEGEPGPRKSGWWRR